MTLPHAAARSLLVLLLGDGLLFGHLSCDCAKSRASSHHFTGDVPSCKASKPGGVLKIEEHTPDVSATPASLDAAMKVPVMNETGNCYDVWLEPENAMCCCAFWQVPTTEKDVALASQDREACSKSFATSFPGPNDKRMDKASCRIAIALSGISGAGADAEKVFAQLEQHVIGQRKDVCVAVFAGVNASDEAPLKALLDSKNYVVDFALEVTGKTDADVAKTTVECTEHVFDKISEQWKTRYNKPPPNSTAYMYRKIWLAHKMARSLNNQLQLIMRGRVDGVHKKTLDWNALLQKTNVLIGVPVPWLYEKRSGGVEYMKQCLTDDQLALGPPAAMDGYASVFPDISRISKYLLAHRVDSWGHFNERLNRLHMHFRGVTFEITPSIDQRIHYEK